MFSKYSVKNVRTYYDFNGNKGEDCMDDSKKIGGKSLYCQVCERFVCKEEDYQDIYGQVNEDLMKTALKRNAPKYGALLTS